MKVTFKWLSNEAFSSVPKQVHVQIDGQYYRIFGEGDERWIRKIISSEKQPKLTGKKLIAEILNAVDSVPYTNE